MSRMTARDARKNARGVPGRRGMVLAIPPGSHQWEARPAMGPFVFDGGVIAWYPSLLEASFQRAQVEIMEGIEREQSGLLRTGRLQ